MKKKFLILPVLAALFAACTSDELVVVDNQTQQTEEDGAIAFDAYLTRSVTRAGAVGGIDLAKLQTTGFGVFGYYANGDLYSENAIPDFMYNQEVKYSGGWEYSPIKYWPNEFGSSAISTGVDRVTFFAYAPYVAVEPSTGQLTSYYDNTGSTAEKSTETGITALTRNGKTGDPYVRYVGAFKPSDCVDLLYGVAAENYTSSVGAADGANSIKKGDPYINVAKPEVSSRLKFDFKHALAQLNIQVDADVDLVTHGDADALDGNTRIWVRSISFDGIAQRGYLNLNNGIWYDVIDNTKISHASVTVHDGRRDGAEALADDSYETPTGLNPTLVQSVEYTTVEEPNTVGVPTYTSLETTGVTGVTGVNQSLFEGGSVLVIPANEQLKVTIVYDVETADPTLSTYLSDGKTKGSTVENKITKSITLDGKALKLESGNRYTLNLHLGMTSVKFDAEVSGWADENIADNTWLPENLLTVAAGSTTSNYNVPAAGGEYSIKITGLAGTSMKAASKSGDIPTADPTWTNDNPASSGIMTFTIPKNTSVGKKTGAVTLTETRDGSTTITTTINITQAAAPLGLSVNEVNVSARTLTLKMLASDGWDADDKTGIADAISTYTDGPSSVKRIQVKKGSEDLTGSNTTLATKEFSFDKSNGKITFFDAINVGDVFTITVKAGDADAETVTVHIGGPMLSDAAETIEYGETYTRLPEFYGPATPSYTWTVSSGSAVTVDAGVVTSVAAGDATIQLTTTNIPAANGWVYDTSNRTYNVTVTKATGTISYALEDVTGQTITADDVVVPDVAKAVLKNVNGDVLTAGSGAGGSVTYEIQDVDGDTSQTLFALDGNVLKVGTGVVNNNTYTIHMKATVTSNSNVDWGSGTAAAVAEFTVTTVP